MRNENSENSAIWEWLTDTGSLSQRLRLYTGGVISHILHQADWGVVLPSEKAILNLDADSAWIREVEWRHHDTTWIRARVVIPASSFEGPACELQHITGAPLGDTLFRDPNLKRSRFYYETQTHHFQQPTQIRRSIFYYYQQPILVSEAFLPTFISVVESNACQS